jgi:phosphonate transport system permease protein
MDKKKDIMNIPKQPISQRILKYTLTTAIVFASLWSAAGLEITIERILDAPRQIGILVGAMFPLDTSQEAIDRIIPKVFESLFIAWAGTVIGAIFSFPVSFLAAQNVAVGAVSRITKQILNAIRAFPELILAFVFLPITGLGAFTGTLASGGSKINELIFGVIPQVMPTITSYWLYRFEINLRASAVLGVIGAGGVGQELINQLRFRDFPRAGTVLICTIALVLIADAISASIRNRIIQGKVVKS